MALHLTSSNRFERLLDALLAGLARTDASPFAPDRVIVPSMAVRRSIELAAADKFGICANVQFHFLAQWLWEQIAKVVPGIDETSPFAPARLTWRILRMVGDGAFTARHAPLHRYLGSADALMRYELAQRVATLFDQYITYRPDWLEAWMRGRLVAHDSAAFAHEPWQAELWRMIVAELGTSRQHPSVAFFNALRNGSVDVQQAALPAVAHVFCLPAIAPLYVDMLRELARSTELFVYMLNPCEEYWAHIDTPRRVAEARVRGGDEHREVGNRLLAQWGSQTRSHFETVLKAWDGAAIEAFDYAPTASNTLLARVQRSMLDLAEIEPGSMHDLSAHDRSIEVHVCHSLTRELEVLQDQLLAMFAADPTLRPGDVLVVTPDLDRAAPLVEAVFGTADRERRIAYDITGRARSTANVAARALLDVLALAASRMPASGVMELLQQPIVARTFALDAAGLDSIRSWIRAAGIRWGLDATHRAAFDVPALARHTFADGLDRLLLGYALPSSSRDALAEWLPAGNAEGSDAAALGSFAEALQRLGAARRELAQPKTPAQWHATLQQLVAAFLLPREQDELEDMRELQVALRTLHQNVVAGAAATPVAPDVIRVAVAETLDDPAHGGVPGGGVTFASMSSLRNVPYRVICALGLDDGVFPALDRPFEFDLVAAFPRAGDRQRRAEDRNIFLDLLLGARERLLLSYTGRDIRDNTVLPPSVIVSDLLDVLVPAMAPDSRSEADLATARERLVIHHPLQPFSIEYFEPDADERMRSFNAEYCAALQRRLCAPTSLHVAAIARDIEDADDVAQEPEVAFAAAPLSTPGDEWRVVTREQLQRFFFNPCRYLLRERLGIALPEAEDELADEEPFTADWPARSALAERLLPSLLEGASIDAVRKLARAGIEYPPGRFGERLLDNELALLEAYAAQVRRDTARAPLEPMTHEVTVDVDGEAWRVQFAFSDVRTSGRVLHRYDEIRPTEYVSGWIDHLLLNALDACVVKETVWHSRDGTYRLRSVPEAAERLRELVTLYAQGLRAPLHFFPRTSWTYAITEGNLVQAERKWFTTPSYRFGEDRHPAYQLALRGVENPLDAAFERCATLVLAPLLEVLDDPRVKRP